MSTRTHANTSRPRLALLAVLLLIATALSIQPADADPCPWGTNCITVTLLAPTADATLTGTVALEASAVQDEPDARGDIVNVEWWLYHPSFVEQVPGNVESKILLDESSTPATGTGLDGIWTGSWTVADTITTRDGWYDAPSPDERTYDLPADDGGYVLEAHVLDEEWVRSWGGPPGRSEATPVTIDFGSGSEPPPPPPGDGAVDITGLTMPTSVEVLPSGRVYISEKGGAIKTAASLSSSSANTVLMVDTFTNADHGLQSLAYRDGYLYAAYTGLPLGDCNPDDFGQEGAIGCVVHGQIDRFPVDDSTGALGTAEEVRGGPDGWCAQFQTHGIDDIEFGPGGYLYVSAGDGAGYSVADTGQFDGDPCGGGGALRAQSPSNLAGNVVRLDVTTGDTTTVAYGFRNPYRISFRPDSSELFVGDVGWYTAEEINRVDVDGPVTNHGWPCREGNGPMPVYAGLDACSGVTGAAPIHAYTHDGVNAAVSAVGFHAGRVYYGDYHRRFIRSIAPDGTGDRFERDGVMPVDMLSTPEGLVYVDIGAGALRSLSIETPAPPPDSPPFAEVVVAESGWTPSQTIDYAVDYRNFGRQPVQVQWTITRSDGSVVASETASPPGPDGRHSGSMTAPSASYPETLTFTAVVSNAQGDEVEVSRTRAMAEPSDPAPSPPPSEPAPSDPPPSDPPPSDPTPSDPAPSDPAPSDPPPSDPAPSDPPPSDPTPSDPTPSDPTPSDPTPSDPTPSDPTPSDPTPSDPTPSDPTPDPDDTVVEDEIRSIPTDIDGNIHREAILRLVEQEIIAGYPDGTYRPANKVTRGQMASLLARTLDLTLLECTEGEECDGPSDIAGTTHAAAIRAIVAAEIAGGYEDGTYRPNEFVTRAQMASFLANAFGLDLDDPTHPFTDVGDGVHTAAIAAIRRAGITLGTSATTYDPGGDVRRDQMASFIDRARDLTS